MQRLIHVLLLAFFFFTSLEGVHIAVVTDGPSAAIDKVRLAFEYEIKALLDGEFEVSFSNPTEFQGRFSKESIDRALEKAEESPNVDLIITLGVIASNIAAHDVNLKKPTFAPLIINAELQQTPINDDQSGIRNLNYLTFPTNMERDLTVFQDLVPFQKLAILVSESVQSAIPQISKNLMEFASHAGISITLIPLGKDHKKAFQQIPSDVDAAYLSPIFEMQQEEIDLLIQGLNDRKIPSFSLFGKGYLDSGVLASMSPDSDLPRMSRRIALNIQRTLLGEKPSTLPILLPAGRQLTINMITAEKIDIWPPWDLMLEAELIYPSEIETTNHSMTLIEAVELALCCNRELASSEQEVYVGREEVRLKSSRLKPQIKLNTFGRFIDADRARLSLGTEPQSAWFGSVSGHQVLYSNELSGSYKAERYLQRARCDEFESQKLNTIAKAAVAYLNLLRSKTLEQIQRNNLRLTRTNLKIAKTRETVGVARASEVLRWETAIANDHATVIDAHYQTRAAEVNLNRILHLPMNQPADVLTIDLKNNDWAIDKIWMNDTIYDDFTLELFNQYAVMEGLTLSPEVRQLEALIHSQSEVLGIRKKAFWTPTVSLVGEVSNRFKSGGAKGETPLRPVNTTDWFAGVDATFPLYQGGEKKAGLRQARYQLKQLCLQMEAVSEEIERSIRSTVYRATATYASINLSRKAAKAASKNLKLVSNEYSKGSKTILDLLDAQNQSLVADLITANAVYDFLIEVINVQRVIGKFSFLETEREKFDWLSQVTHYIEVNR